MLNKIILLFKLIIAGITGVIVWQLLGYLWLADTVQMDTITQYMPGDKKWDIVCLDTKTVKELTTAQLDYLDLLLGHRFDKIFHGEKKVPGKYLRYEYSKTPRGSKAQPVVQKIYTNGLEVRFQVVDAGIMWYKGSYTYYESPQTRKNVTAEFVWVLGRWVPFSESRNI